MICFLFQSLAKGPIGPSFLDLQAISGVGLESGSSLLTTLYIGYMLSAIVSGCLFDKFHRSLLLSAAMFLLACATVAIPWCSMYWLMVIAFFCLGAMVGATDAIANAEVQRIWGKDGKPFMQGLQFMYSFGFSVAPLLTILFLEIPSNIDLSKLHYPEQNHNTSLTNYSTSLNKTVLLQNRSSQIANHSQIYEDSAFVRSPYIYKAFIIGGCVSLSAFVILLVFYCTFDRQNKTNHRETESTTPAKSRLPLRLRVLGILHMAGIQALLSGIDDTLMAFLTAFCVKELDWTKAEGALLTSVGSFVAVAGRFIAIFLVQVISPIKLVGFHSVLTLIVFIGFYISTLQKSNIGIWIVSSLFGYAKAPVLACVFSWTDEVFLPVTGRISSIFLVFITANSASNPLILGFFMDNFSNMWFCYLFLGESVLLVLVVGSALLLTRRVKTTYGTNYESRRVDIKVTEDLLDN
ncbi:Sodium-dependent glucose transporter 1A [Mizuhopecten yessoensis]|uniref:Sodium-dependent glucose transporter 1A n=1 Tax=Mizuhopecten yessoensis TaxID=6573 RepID=A0A210PF63_MIZYE|nr:Sodium-dependent glucose transporter 1A [Mizuhopecten yessoensis]